MSPSTVFLYLKTSREMCQIVSRCWAIIFTIFFFGGGDCLKLKRLEAYKKGIECIYIHKKIVHENFSSERYSDKNYFIAFYFEGSLVIDFRLPKQMSFLISLTSRRNITLKRAPAFLWNYIAFLVYAMIIWKHIFENVSSRVLCFWTFRSMKT